MELADFVDAARQFPQDWVIWPKVRFPSDSVEKVFLG
jgi:hypothetical protein